MNCTNCNKPFKTENRMVSIFCNPTPGLTERVMPQCCSAECLKEANENPQKHEERARKFFQENNPWIKKIEEGSIGAKHELDFIHSVGSPNSVKEYMKVKYGLENPGGKMILGSTATPYRGESAIHKLKEFIENRPTVEVHRTPYPDDFVKKEPIQKLRSYRLAENLCPQKWDNDKQQWVKVDPNHIHSPDCVRSYTVTENDLPPRKKLSRWKRFLKFITPKPLFEKYY